jgi:hypothetical protein
VYVDSPELPLNHFPRNELAGMRYEDAQQLEGLWPEPYGPTRLAELQGGRVEIEDAEPNDLLVIHNGRCLCLELFTVYNTVKLQGPSDGVTLVRRSAWAFISQIIENSSSAHGIDLLLSLTLPRHEGRRGRSTLQIVRTAQGASRAHDNEAGHQEGRDEEHFPHRLRVPDLGRAGRR